MGSARLHVVALSEMTTSAGDGTQIYDNGVHRWLLPRWHQAILEVLGVISHGIN